MVAYYRVRIAESTGDSRCMWRTAKELLHSGIVKQVLSPEESSKLVKSFTEFFTNKLEISVLIFHPG